jgi:hypothetical protein
VVRQTIIFQGDGFKFWVAVAMISENSNYEC